jgi:hypothetical protein
MPSSAAWRLPRSPIPTSVVTALVYVLVPFGYVALELTIHRHGRHRRHRLAFRIAERHPQHLVLPETSRTRNIRDASKRVRCECGFQSGGALRVRLLGCALRARLGAAGCGRGCGERRAHINTEPLMSLGYRRGRKSGSMITCPFGPSVLLLSMAHSLALWPRVRLSGFTPAPFFVFRSRIEPLRFTFFFCRWLNRTGRPYKVIRAQQYPWWYLLVNLVHTACSRSSSVLCKLRGMNLDYSCIRRGGPRHRDT